MVVWLEKMLGVKHHSRVQVVWLVKLLGVKHHGGVHQLLLVHFFTCLFDDGGEAGVLIAALAVAFPR